MKEWEGSFGNKYIKRNIYTLSQLDKDYYLTFGMTRSQMNEDFLGKLNRHMKILEVGSNIGLKLRFLADMGFKDLYGIEINEEAINLANKLNTRLPIYIIKGSAFDIPFKDNYFGLVFTSGVLIHINPLHIKHALREIYRVTKKYIWGSEYYADRFKEVIYRGKKNLLWKTDYAKLYTDMFNDLILIKEKRYSYLDNLKKINTMFLLKKTDKR